MELIEKHEVLCLCWSHALCIADPWCILNITTKLHSRMWWDINSKIFQIIRLLDNKGK